MIGKTHPPVFGGLSQAESWICTATGVRPSSWRGSSSRQRRRPESARARYDAVLLARIRDRHVASGGSYGAPRIRADLADERHHLAIKRVARLMRVAGLCGESRRTGVMTTTPGS